MFVHVVELFLPLVVFSGGSLLKKVNITNITQNTFIKGDAVHYLVTYSLLFFFIK